MIRLLHLSDLHFGVRSDGTSAHRYVNAGGEPNPSVLAGRLVAGRSLHPHAVVVSGDVGWSGAGADYGYATEFLAALRTAWPGAALVVAPGNHDVDLSSSPARQEAFRAFVQGFDGGRLAPAYRVAGASGRERQTLVSFDIVSGDEGEQLLLVSANSAAYVGDAGNPGSPVGFSADDLHAIESVLRTPEFSSIRLRAFIVHHALFPFAEPSWDRTINLAELRDKPDLEIVANSAVLQAWLADHGFAILLHGHKHTMHARLDRLWRRGGPASGAQLLSLGAGSVGVEQAQRGHGEPLSYNAVDLTRVSAHRWLTAVEVNDIPDPPARPQVSARFECELGEDLAHPTHVFHAETIVDCHRAIALRCASAGLLKTFVSVVEQCQFELPATARFAKRRVTMADIEGSFEALHPEHAVTDGWNDLRGVDASMRRMGSRLQFQHGPRLFERVGGAEKSAIVRALDLVGHESRSDAYAGLYRAEVDVAATKDALTPHLMGVQFNAEDGYLDVVATFRKIELSYWWVANMYELSRLLTWAAAYGANRTRTPRRITVFAAFAEWKERPGAAVVARLDRMTIEELTTIAVGFVAGDAAAATRLCDLLIEKREYTSDRNLDANGLASLCAVLRGATGGFPEGRLAKRRKQVNSVLGGIGTASEQVKSGIEGDRPALAAAARARESLEAVIVALRRGEDVKTVGKWG
ncbi:MAG: metallophosphoesterase [Myxococcota bacterium]